MKQGVRIVVEALQRQRQRFAVDANLYKMGVKCYSTERAFKKYQALSEQIEKLGGPPPADAEKTLREL